MKQNFLPVAALLALVFSSCTKEKIITSTQPPSVSISTPAGGFAVDNAKWFTVSPTVKSDGLAMYAWTLGSDTIATTKDLAYVFAEGGNYTLTFSATNSVASASQQITVTVAAKTYSIGVSHVFEFLPAPGQFTNGLPQWVQGDTDSTMAAKAEEQLKTNGLISLGAYGGYVTMGFDHTIVNVEGQPNFIVEGNAFGSWSEAGIIMVSADANGNGKPDDEWYEIAGSEYNSPQTVHNYKITYYKPDENKVPTPDGMYQADTTYIRWKDNQGQSGYVFRNVFNTGVYWPLWKNVDSLTFSGSKLTGANIQDLSGEGTNYISPSFSWGYADNQSNDNPGGMIHISWAVDGNGKPVHLVGIDFIKVYTGMNASAGWLGEISTEVAQVRDLNIK